MDDSKCTLSSIQRQEPALELPPKKPSCEIVRSADLSRSHYFSPRFNRIVIDAQGGWVPLPEILAIGITK